MSYEWGRAPEAGRWQRAVPVWFMSVIVIAAGQRHRGLAGPSDVRLDAAAAVLSVRLHAQRRWPARSAFGPAAIGVLLMENRRGSRLAIDDEVVPITLPTGETTFALSELARQAGSGRLVWRDLVVRPRPSPCAAPRVDLRGPDADGPGAAVADHGVRRLDRWPADRDSERRAVGAIAPPRPTVEGTGAGLRAAVQSPDARERDRVRPDAAACRPSCWAFSRRSRFRAPSSRAICSSWATPARASRR